MNPHKQIFGLKGEVLRKSFPSEKEIEALSKKEKEYPDGRKIMVLDMDKLEVETVGNIILNCLTAYQSRDKKDGFYINCIANSILTYKKGEKLEFKAKLQKFLIEILEDSMIRKVKTTDDNEKKREETKGFYAGWILARVFEELGVNLEE